MEVTEWGELSVDGFWEHADRLQQRTLEHARDLFAFVETAAPEQLANVLVQYRYFTVYYIADLAILVARLSDGNIRTFLADTLSDELGYGDAAQAHPRLYDDFLGSLGVAVDRLDHLALDDNIRLLETARRRLMDPHRSPTYAIGLRGMGGECVCQIYLAQLYTHFIKNPHIRAKQADIDWRFWELHVGEHDIAHRERTRQLIHEEIVTGGGNIGDLGRGYNDSMQSWSAFWSNILEAVDAPEAARCSVQSAATFPVLSDTGTPAGM